jgi:hypothetical protein
MRMNPAAKAAEQRARRDHQELRWGANPGSHKILAADVEERTQANVVVIGREKTRAKEEYARRHRNWFGQDLPNGEEPRLVIGLVGVTYAAAVAVALIDVVVSAIIGAATFNLGWLGAATAGALLAVGLTVIFKGICGHLAARFEERPRKAIALLSRALLVVAIPWTVCFFGALYLGRAAAGGEYADTLFNAIITALALLSPLLSALLLVCAGIRGWDRGPFRLYHRLEKVEVDLAEVRRHCKIRHHGDGPGPGEPPSEKNTPPAARAAAVLLATLLLPAITFAQGIGQIWVDQSGSSEPASVAAALDASFALLPQVTAAAAIREVEVYGFAGDAFDAAPVGKPVQVPPFVPPDCSAGAKKSDRARIFKTPDHDQECAAKIENARKRHEEAFAAEIQRAREELTRHVPSNARRTCLIDLLGGLTMPGRQPVSFAIVITDGVETCEPRGKEAVPQPSRTMDVVFVLVPGRNTSSVVSPRRRFQELKRIWEQRAPWLKAVVPRSGLSAGLFRRDAPALQK